MVPEKPGGTGLGNTNTSSFVSPPSVAVLRKEQIPFDVAKYTSPVLPSMVIFFTSLLNNGLLSSVN